MLKRWHWIPPLKDVYQWYHQYTRYMESKEMPVRQVRDQLGKRVDAAHYGGEATIITTNGEPRAVIVPHSWWINENKNAPGHR